MAGFKLFVFDREAHFIGPQESGCSTIGRSQKAVWILAHMPFLSDGGGRTVAIPVHNEQADSEVFLLHKVLFF